QVVDHGQGLGTDADHVVRVHRDAVDADRVPASHPLRDDQLGADAVGGDGDAGPLIQADDVGVVATVDDLAALPGARAECPDEGGDGIVGPALADARPSVCVAQAGRSGMSTARRSAARPGAPLESAPETGRPAAWSFSDAARAA